MARGYWGLRSPKRALVISELRRGRPMTAKMLRERIGGGDMSLIVSCMVLEGLICARSFRGGRWYAIRPSAFTANPYVLERSAGKQWVVFRMVRSERGARQEGAFYAAQWPDSIVRLMRGNRVLHQWNQMEAQAWLEGKRTFLQLKKMLRGQSRLPNVASTPALTSPQ